MKPLGYCLLYLSITHCQSGAGVMTCTACYHFVSIIGQVLEALCENFKPGVCHQVLPYPLPPNQICFLTDLLNWNAWKWIMQFSLHETKLWINITIMKLVLIVFLHKPQCNTTEDQLAPGRHLCCSSSHISYLLFLYSVKDNFKPEIVRPRREWCECVCDSLMSGLSVMHRLAALRPLHHFHLTPHLSTATHVPPALSATTVRADRQTTWAIWKDYVTALTPELTIARAFRCPWQHVTTSCPHVGISPAGRSSRSSPCQ